MVELGSLLMFGQFANNFWGKDDAGVGPMLDRLHTAKQTSDELKSFLRSARSNRR